MTPAVLFPTVPAKNASDFYLHAEKHTTTALYVASSFADQELANKRHATLPLDDIPAPRVPSCVRETIADWGGFSILNRHGGIPPFTELAYVRWLLKWRPTHASFWDYPCADLLSMEDSDAVTKEVRKRQLQAAIDAQRLCYQLIDLPLYWIVTLQGRTSADYIFHAQMLRPFIYWLRDYYCWRTGTPDNAWRIGIGSLVGRSPQEIFEVGYTVADLFPGVKQHWWGVGARTLACKEQPPEEWVSFDTSGWHERYAEHQDDWKEERDERGLPMTQGQWIVERGLPKHRRRIEAAQGQPKQQHLFLPSDLTSAPPPGLNQSKKEEPTLEEVVMARLAALERESGEAASSEERAF